jgi:hypothetical protein
MDGDIVNPGDLHGRVLVAIEVELCWDGNQISALVGPDLVEGVSGWEIPSMTLCANWLAILFERLCGST